MTAIQDALRRFYAHYFGKDVGQVSAGQVNPTANLLPFPDGEPRYFSLSGTNLPAGETNWDIVPRSDRILRIDGGVFEYTGTTTGVTIRVYFVRGTTEYEMTNHGTLTSGRNWNLFATVYNQAIESVAPSSDMWFVPPGWKLRITVEGATLNDDVVCYIRATELPFLYDTPEMESIAAN